jgi:GNAT superfamily N-acetyltransferase
MISFQPTKDLTKAAQITYSNMLAYYEHYLVDWEQSRILEQTLCLDNWDILYDGEVVGILRLAFDSEGCFLRDLQVSEMFQNKGVGARALLESKQLAIKSGAGTLRLRVFKISPAFHLYKRDGFTVSHEDNKFYYMEQKIS